MPPQPKPIEERLWPRVDKNGPPPDYRPDLGPCWLWLGQTSYGYGRISPGGAAKNGLSSLMVHRVVYELTRGPIPDGLVLDHLCRVLRCCNPWHVEPVPQRINLHRGFGPPPPKPLPKTHCIRGHAFDETNTSYTKKGHKICRECMRLHKSPQFLTRQRSYTPKGRKSN